jgi:hypothetical protein
MTALQAIIFGMLLALTLSAVFDVDAVAGRQVAVALSPQ